MNHLFSILVIFIILIISFWNQFLLFGRFFGFFLLINCCDCFPFFYSAHHLFAVWNGDRRLQDKFGEKAAIIRERTSVIPFAAILSGRQKLPDNYIEEFLRPPYFAIVLGSVGAYFAHPYMQAGAALLKW